MITRPRPASALRPPPVLLDSEQVAEILKVSTKTLEKWRWKHIGPPVTRFGKKPLYDQELLNQWLDQHTSGAPTLEAF